MNRGALLAFVVARAQESSTWGAVLAAGGTVAGMHLAPDKASAIGLIGTLVAGAIAAGMPQAKKPPPNPPGGGSP